MNNKNILSTLKCKPCSGSTPKIKHEEIIENLSKIDNWKTNDQKELIFKKFTFNNFKKTIKFVNQISEIAEIEGHHPDISFGWGYCLVMIHTHAINGLSINDFILASKIDEVQ